MCLQACEDEYKQQLAENRVTDDVKFTYSWHLIKSQYKNDIKKGIRLMDGKSGRGGGRGGRRGGERWKEGRGEVEGRGEEEGGGKRGQAGGWKTDRKALMCC